MENVAWDQVKIHINRNEFTSGQFMVVIPDMYREQVEKINFPTIHDFSQAVAFMGCAVEALNYEKLHKFEQYNDSFNWYVRNCPLK